MQQVQKEPWDTPKLKTLDLSEDILDGLAPKATTPEQQKRIEELRKEIKRDAQR